MVGIVKSLVVLLGAITSKSLVSSSQYYEVWCGVLKQLG